MKLHFLLFSFLLFIVACHNDEPTKTIETTYEWSFSELPDKNGTPRASVYIITNGDRESRVKVYNGMGEYGEMNRRDFGLYQVPSTAYSACIGYWSGISSVLYLEKKEEKMRIYIGTIDEATETTMEYEVLRDL